MQKDKAQVVRSRGIVVVLVTTTIKGRLYVCMEWSSSSTTKGSNIEGGRLILAFFSDLGQCLQCLQNKPVLSFFQKCKQLQIVIRREM